MKFKFLKILTFFTFLFLNISLYADTPHYIDFKYILNESTAGKKAQTTLKTKLEKGIDGINGKQKALREEEKKIIQQKKLIKPEEYKKKVEELRKKVIKLQKERASLMDTVSKQRIKARNELLKNLNPIISEYMKGKNIRMVIDKKNLILADKTLDITKDVMDLLNKKIKSIKIN